MIPLDNLFHYSHMEIIVAIPQTLTRRGLAAKKQVNIALHNLQQFFRCFLAKNNTFSLLNVILTDSNEKRRKLFFHSGELTPRFCTSVGGHFWPDSWPYSCIHFIVPTRYPSNSCAYVAFMTRRRTNVLLRGYVD